jgi:hypothetical protein
MLGALIISKEGLIDIIQVGVTLLPKAFLEVNSKD